MKVRLGFSISIEKDVVGEWKKLRKKNPVFQLTKSSQAERFFARDPPPVYYTLFSPFFSPQDTRFFFFSQVTNTNFHPVVLIEHQFQLGLTFATSARKI